MFDLFFYFRTQYIRVSGSHEEKVKAVQKQVNAWRASGSTAKM
jgi:hypothetical protein